MFVFFASIIKSQSNVENIYAPSAGYYSGGFLNLADDGLDAEVFLNLQNKLGLYNNMWAGQIDYYSNTDIVSNVSFGLNRAISKTISYDLGLGSNITFSNEVQTTPEYFTGIDINGFSFYAYFQENDITYESWFKPGIEMLSSPNLDMLFYIYVENDGYEINCNVSRQLNQGVIGGVILGYENYSDELNYQQQDGSKSFKISNTYSRISIKAYLGFLYY